jgi:hypothetical protein
LERKAKHAVFRSTWWTRFGLLFALLTAAALLQASNDPWKNKPYQQWTEQEINGIFQESPWSHTITVTRMWIPLVNRDLPQGPLAGTGRSMPGTPEQATDVARGGDVRFFISWVSSRVMREASARYAVLHYGKDPAEEDKKLDQQAEEYSILVQGDDMTPFQLKDEKYYQANAYLLSKNTKQKFSPSHLNYERKPNGTAINSVFFFFPKTSASGDPLIASDEKGVAFICRLEGPTLKADFELKKMTVQGKPDL